MAKSEELLRSKYPAKEHAGRVADAIINAGGDPKGVIYLESQKTRMLEDSDHPEPFRQRRYFYYLTGCDLPDCFMTYELDSGKLTLFIPPIDPEDVMWSGLPTTTEEALAKYDVDAVETNQELNPFLASSQHSQSTVYAIPNQIADQTTFLSFREKNLNLLKPTIDNCRAIKSSFEIALITQANEVSTAAHVGVMKAVKSASNERELEALFLKICHERGCPSQAYHGIFAGGTSAATLHYIHNNAPLAGKLNLLLDAGCESHNYASDITRTFPVNGKFTDESRAIYDIVLQMQLECLEMLKEGVIWDDVHTHAHRVAIRGLLNLGILKSGTLDEILEARTSVAFFPHGLGHYLGMDTHDTGGNPNYKDEDPMFRYLRKRGALPVGSVITVEPGVYFCRFIIEPYLKDAIHGKYIDVEVLNKYWDVGGVRIEDNVLITKDGYENLTPTPKTVEDMERLINAA